VRLAEDQYPDEGSGCGVGAGAHIAVTGTCHGHHRIGGRRQFAPAGVASLIVSDCSTHHRRSVV
jgi:hypothetical protein